MTHQTTNFISSASAQAPEPAPASCNLVQRPLPVLATVSTALIKVHNLRLRTYIGFNPEEKTKLQDVVINIDIRYAVGQGALHDQVEDALDYKTITKKIINHVEGGRFLLLEKLVADLLVICSDHSDVEFASVTIEKPHALRFADSVSLTLQYQPNQTRQRRE